MPLFLLGSYSPPFLDFIESAGITTIPTNLADSLRGTSNWVPYVDSGARAGTDLIREFYLPINSAVVLMAGVVGIALRRTPHRLFLVSGAVTGLFLVSMGHVGSVQGWFAPGIQDLLDGVLAPLRNVHKFDAVVRLPLVLGLAWLVDALVAYARDSATRADRVNHRILAGIVAFAVLAAATPAAAGRITPTGGFEEVPDYWSEAAQWLADDEDPGVALLVPGTMFAGYVWGSPRDEPFQALASTRWAVRNAVPLTPAGNIRMLDAVEDQLAQGHGSPALADYLRRSGVSHLVVRNDVARNDDTPDPVLVHQALDESDGIELAATFGPVVGGGAHIDGELGRALVNGGWQNDYAAIEIYALEEPPAAGTGTAQAPVVVGGPEDLLDLTALGVVDDIVPTRLAADLGDEEVGDAPLVLTDGYRSVVRHFGRIHDATSPVRTRAQAQAPQETVPDYQLPDTDRWSTYAEYDGIDGVRASSSLSDAGAAPSSTGRLPFAAIDGRPSTSWQSARFTEDAHWWEVDLEDDVVPGSVVVSGGIVGDQEIEVSTDDWTSDPIVLAPDTPTRITVGDTESDHLRITDVSGRTSTPLDLAEVEMQGITPSRLLALPEVPEGAGAPDAIVLRALGDERTGCAVVDLDVRCVQGREALPEEPLGMARRITLPDAAAYDASLRVRGIPGRALEALVLQDSFVDVRASSSGIADPRGSILAAVDGNDATTWSADLSDVRPTVDLRWLRPQEIDSIELGVDPDTAARAPQSLELRWPGGRRSVELDEDGTATFPTIRTDELTLDVVEAEPATTVDFSGATGAVPVGITELRLGGAQGLPALITDDPLELPCGTGPDVVTNAVRLHTSVSASALDLFNGVAVSANPCGTATLPLRSGENTVVLSASDAFTPVSAVLGRGALPLGEGATVEGGADGVGGERFLPQPGQVVVAGHENTNPGWRATQDGADVSPVVVDGWRQGWRGSGEPTEIVADFAPGTAYRWSLVVGAVGVLALLLVLLLRRRRRPVRDLPGVEERSLPPLVPLLLAPVAGALLAGATGAVVALVATAAVWLVRRAHTGVAVALVAVLVLPAVGVYAFLPWGGFDAWAGSLAWPSYLVVAVVAGLLVLLDADSRRRSRPLRRRAGSSTSR